MKFVFFLREKKKMENENQMTMAVSQSTISPSTASIYVGDLHLDMTDGELFDAFKEFKSLTSVRICRDAVTGRSLCYGYVNFISPQDGIHFFSRLIDGCTIFT